MKILRASTFIRSLLLPFATVLWLGLSACTSWMEVKEPVSESLAMDNPDKVLVTLVDGRQIELKWPRLVADSLKGTNSVNTTTGQPIWVSFPLVDVMEVEVRRTDGLKTAGLVVGVGAAAALVLGAIAIATMDNDFFGSSSGSSSTYGSQPISCPLVYSWDGEDWRLDSGTFGGAFLEPLARTDVDNLEFAHTENGLLRLRLANELPETDHVNALDLLVVDHAPGTEVIPDGTGDLHTVGPLSAPVAAIDDHGREALASVKSLDGWSWESSPTGRDTSVAADVRSTLDLDFLRPPGAAEANLVVHGSNTPWAAWLMQDLVAAHGREADSWYASMNADREASRTLGAALAREAFLSVSVHTASGWEPRGLVWEAGPEIAKRQVLHLDLADVEGDTVRIRLESVPLFWHLDQVGIEFSALSAPDARVIEPERVTMEGDGRDVLALLADVDGIELVLETGDAAELSFQVPPVLAGHARSYLIATTGWYRIHAPVSDMPPRPELARIGTEPGAVSRLSVARLNEAIAELESNAAVHGEGGR
jgi:hypothetical protein